MTPSESEFSGDIDRYDRKILDVLSREGRITITELATRVGLSKTPCQVRMKRLERRDFILGYRAVVDPVRLDAAHVAQTSTYVCMQSVKDAAA